MEAGLPVRTEIGGDLEGPPVPIDLVGYRFVQEALTNVLRHAGGTTTSVRVARQPSELTLSVDNEASQTTREEISPGQAICGMHERARALGGEVVAGPRPDGGFRVQARLPFPTEPFTATRNGE